MSLPQVLNAHLRDRHPTTTNWIRLHMCHAHAPEGQVVRLASQKRAKGKIATIVGVRLEDVDHYIGGAGRTDQQATKALGDGCARCGCTSETLKCNNLYLPPYRRGAMVWGIVPTNVAARRNLRPA